MGESDFANLERSALIALILRQAALLERLRADVERLKRGDARQAAPSSKGRPASNPWEPGSEPGQGPSKRREAPGPERLSEPPIDVPVADPDCPARGGAQARPRRGGVPHRPAAGRPAPRAAVPRGREAVRLLRTHGPRPASRVGPRILAAAHRLHYGLGVTARERPEVLGLLTGSRLTQRAITQDALRRSERTVAATYPAMGDPIRQAPYVHTDGTGWRMRGRPTWLMVFVADAATASQARERYRNEEVRGRIPSDYAGVVITDRGRSYNAGELAGVRRQVCQAHVQRSIIEVEESGAGKARWFGSHLKALLKKALALHHGRRAGPFPDFETRARQLERQLTEHLRGRVLRDDDNQRLLDGQGRHQDAGSLVWLLGEPGIAPANNAAGRALRPSVIARKVSQFTKAARGGRVPSRRGRACRRRGAGPCRERPDSTRSSHGPIRSPPNRSDPTRRALISYPP